MAEFQDRQREEIALVDELLKSYQNTACPCCYPRYRYLASFFHENYGVGPVFCGENWLLCLGAWEGPNAFLIKDTAEEENGAFYNCKICDALYELHEFEYGVSFQGVYFTINQPLGQLDVGKAVQFPIPLYSGMVAFDTADVDKLREQRLFVPGSLSAFDSYMRELA